MNLWFRFVLTWLLAPFRKKIGIFDECTTHYRVWLTDIDLLGHLNNGRYLSIADSARLDYLIRSSMFKKLSAKKVYPVIASEMIRFKKSINFLHKFALTTKLLGWDDKYFYIQHQYRKGEVLYALALIRSTFLRKSGRTVTPKEIATILGVSDRSPILPSWISEWLEAEQAFYIDTMPS